MSDSPASTLEAIAQLIVAGRLDEAERNCAACLVANPHDVTAHQLLTETLRLKNRFDDAIAVASAAVARWPNESALRHALAAALLDAGQFDRAIAELRSILAQRPDYLEARLDLGAALWRSEKALEAAGEYATVARLRPDSFDAHLRCGQALAEAKRPDAAVEYFRAAVRLRPDSAAAHNDLGVALTELRQWEAAADAFRDALRLDPAFADARDNLPKAYFELGKALQAQGRLDESAAAFGEVIRLQPRHALAHNGLGVVLQNQGKTDAAAAMFAEAVRLQPDLAVAQSNLGNTLLVAGRVDEAAAAFRTAMAHQPDLADAHNNYANLLKDAGQMDAAIVELRTAIGLAPQAAEVHSNLLIHMHYHAGYDAKAILAEHVRWDRLHAQPLRHEVRPHANSRDPQRRLRIGYVSPDFLDHAVGRFMLPLLENHDRAAFDVWCYADVPAPDQMTARLRKLSQGWRSTTGMSDAQVAEQVRGDQIDILVDLTAHAARNRMLLFARKPAPIQVTYLAYPSTTGLEVMDYRITDPFLDPPGPDRDYYSEQSVHLPQTYWCYQPPAGAPEVNPLPALSHPNDGVTFGCLNTFGKISEPVWETWRQVLLAVPASRLLVHAHEGSHRGRALDSLQANGIDRSRMQFAPNLPIAEYLALYQKMDIALDPFPFNGGTTTCDAMWMGVPVVTLAGERGVSRAGVSLLSNVGLTQLIATSPAQYVQIARKLAGDLPGLAKLRATLRRTMQASPLMDAPSFTRNMEQAYRNMWRRWCG